MMEVQPWLFIDTPIHYAGLHCTDPTGAGLRGKVLRWKASKMAIAAGVGGYRLEASSLQLTRPPFPAR